METLLIIAGIIPATVLGLLALVLLLAFWPLLVVACGALILYIGQEDGSLEMVYWGRGIFVFGVILSGAWFGGFGRRLKQKE